MSRPGEGLSARGRRRRAGQTAGYPVVMVASRVPVRVAGGRPDGDCGFRGREPAASQSGPMGVVDAYAAEEQALDAQGQALAPWPNRLADGRVRLHGDPAAAAPQRAGEGQRHPRSCALAQLLTSSSSAPTGSSSRSSVTRRPVTRLPSRSRSRSPLRPAASRSARRLVTRAASRCRTVSVSPLSLRQDGEGRRRRLRVPAATSTSTRRTPTSSATATVARECDLKARPAGPRSFCGLMSTIRMSWPSRATASPTAHAAAFARCGTDDVPAQRVGHRRRRARPRARRNGQQRLGP
jgi:hypothetical protein